MLGRIPVPYGATAGKVERTTAAILMHRMRQTSEERNLDLGLSDVETSGTDRRMPDPVIYKLRIQYNREAGQRGFWPVKTLGDFYYRD